MVKIEISDHIANVTIKRGTAFVSESFVALHALTGGLAEALHISHENARHLLITGTSIIKDAGNQVRINLTAEEGGG